MAENTLLSKDLGLQEKFDSLQEQLASPDVISDMKKYVQLNKQYKELAPVIKVQASVNRFPRFIRQQRFQLLADCLQFN